MALHYRGAGDQRKRMSMMMRGSILNQNFVEAAMAMSSSEDESSFGESREGVVWGTPPLPERDIDEEEEIVEEEEVVEEIEEVEVWGQLVNLNPRDKKREPYYLDGDHILVGRNPGCDVVLEDPKVSSRHCIILREGGEVYLEDTSRNGVFVNGVKVGKNQRTMLHHGDTIAFLYDLRRGIEYLEYAYYLGGEEEGGGGEEIDEAEEEKNEEDEKEMEREERVKAERSAIISRLSEVDRRMIASLVQNGKRMEAKALLEKKLEELGELETLTGGKGEKKQTEKEGKKDEKEEKEQEKPEEKGISEEKKETKEEKEGNLKASTGEEETKEEKGEEIKEEIEGEKKEGENKKEFGETEDKIEKEAEKGKEKKRTRRGTKRADKSDLAREEEQSKEEKEKDKKKSRRGTKRLDKSDLTKEEEHCKKKEKGSKEKKESTGTRREKKRDKSDRKDVTLLFTESNGGVSETETQKTAGGGAQSTPIVSSPQIAPSKGATNKTTPLVLDDSKGMLSVSGGGGRRRSGTSTTPPTSGDKKSGIWSLREKKKKRPALPIHEEGASSDLSLFPKNNGMEEKGEENEKVVGMGNGSGSSTSKIIHLNIPVDEPSGTDGISPRGNSHKRLLFGKHVPGTGSLRRKRSPRVSLDSLAGNSPARDRSPLRRDVSPPKRDPSPLKKRGWEELEQKLGAAPLKRLNGVDAMNDPFYSEILHRYLSENMSLGNYLFAKKTKEFRKFTDETKQKKIAEIENLFLAEHAQYPILVTEVDQEHLDAHKGTDRMFETLESHIWLELSESVQSCVSSGKFVAIGNKIIEERKREEQKFKEPTNSKGSKATKKEILVTGPVVVSKGIEQKYTGDVNADILLAQEQIQALMAQYDKKEKEFKEAKKRKAADPKPAAFPGIRHHSIETNLDTEVENEKEKEKKKKSSSAITHSKMSKGESKNKSSKTHKKDLLSPKAKSRQPKKEKRNSGLVGELLPPPAEPIETEQERDERRERQFEEFMKQEEEKEEEEVVVDEKEEDILSNFSLNSCERRKKTEFSFAMTDSPEQVLVVDNGSFFLRAGMNTNDKPAFVTKNTVNLDKEETEDKILSSFVSAEQSKNFYEAKCKARSKLFETFYALNDQGIVSNWENQEILWDHMYESLPDVNSTPVLLSELSSAPISEREKKAEIFFEKYDVPSFCCIPDSILSLYSCGLSSGLVIDCGRSTTRITSIYNGMVLRGGQQSYSLKIGAVHLADYLQSLVIQADGGAKNFPSMEYDRYLRNKCYFPIDFGDEFKRVEEASILKRYNLLEIPGVKKPVDMAKMRFHATYPLFKPSLFGSVDLALPRAIQNVVNNVPNDEDFQSVLWKNIILSGGTSSIHGFHTHLQQSLQSLCLDKEIHVIAQSDRVLNTWIGGQILTHFESFPQMMIKNEEYQEVGPRIVNWMCPY